jgi:hypothetical protein
MSFVDKESWNGVVDCDEKGGDGSEGVSAANITAVCGTEHTRRSACNAAAASLDRLIPIPTPPAVLRVDEASTWKKPAAILCSESRDIPEPQSETRNTT